MGVQVLWLITNHCFQWTEESVPALAVAAWFVCSHPDRTSHQLWDLPSALGSILVRTLSDSSLNSNLPSQSKLRKQVASNLTKPHLLCAL